MSYTSITDKITTGITDWCSLSNLSTKENRKLTQFRIFLTSCNDHDVVISKMNGTRKLSCISIHNRITINASHVSVVDYWCQNSDFKMFSTSDK